MLILLTALGFYARDGVFLDERAGLLMVYTRLALGQTPRLNAGKRDMRLAAGMIPSYK